MKPNWKTALFGGIILLPLAAGSLFIVTGINNANKNMPAAFGPAGRLPEDIALQIAECMPKSDTASRDKCAQLIGLISNFEDCKKAGFPILETTPPTCQTPDGIKFGDVK